MQTGNVGWRPSTGPRFVMPLRREPKASSHLSWHLRPRKESDNPGPWIDQKVLMMDYNPSASKPLLEDSHRYPGDLSRLAKGELALLKQRDGKFPLHLLWGHAGRMQDFLGNHVNSSSNALASCKSTVSNPSVNQSYTPASSCCASLRLPCCCQRRLRLMATRSSQDLACWRRAMA